MKLCHIVPVLLLSVTLSFSVVADVTDLNRRGVEACKNGDYHKGTALFAEAFTADPGNKTVAGNLVSATRNLAAQQFKNGKPEEAAGSLRKSLSLIPDNKALRGDLISVLYNQGIDALKNRNIPEAEKKSREALEVDPSSPPAHILAGETDYAKHRMQQALGHWKQAFDADPSNSRLAGKIEKLKQELSAEKQYSKTDVHHFNIQFDYKTLGNGVYDIRDFLLDAYNRVGQDFGCFPKYPTVVILYGENEFRMANNVPEFIAGLYDGKIRVPVNFSRYPLATLKGILFHEYAHAVVYDLARSACPIWLNEGIAMRAMAPYLPVNTDVLKKAIKTNSLMSLDQLAAPGTWRNPRLVALAYSQSWIMAEYLFYRWSGNQIKKMLQQFRDGGTFHTQLVRNMNRTPEQFEEEWLQFAKKRLF
jgi:tetratricopeptide (TPR) repeat protein